MNDAHPSLPDNAISTANRSHILCLNLQAKIRLSQPNSRIFCSLRPYSNAHSKGDGIFAPSCSRRLFMHYAPIRVLSSTDAALGVVEAR